MRTSRSKGVSQRDIRAWREREKAFWLKCAERAENPATDAHHVFLCNQALHATDDGQVRERKAAIALFQAHDDMSQVYLGVIWLTCEQEDGLGDHLGFNSERILAALLLAAMAEAGDLDWTREAGA